MPHRHQPAATTHTVELRQVEEINRRLADPAHADVTADSIGVAGRSTAPSAPFHIDLFGAGLPTTPALRSTAVLRSVSAEGSPQFPHVLGHFSGTVGTHRADDAGPVIELHPDALHRLSSRLGLRHCWGTDDVLEGGRPWPWC